MSRLRAAVREGAIRAHEILNVRKYTPLQTQILPPSDHAFVRTKAGSGNEVVDRVV